MQFNPAVSEISESPISATFALLPQRAGSQPLLDLSQAAPTYPPADVVIDRIIAAAGAVDGGRYTPSLGLPALREAFAAELAVDYEAPLGSANVMITAGCNQAFCVVASSLAGPGDEIIVTVPYYFNHSMWCDAEGVRIRYLEAGTDGQPDPNAAAALVSDRTRAILVVTPGNPSGVVVSPEVIGRFADLAATEGIALILDETYRNFRSTSTPPHAAFVDPAWADSVVSLHSFSKDLAIPGYRVGAVVAGERLIAEAAKVLDCVAICAPRVGQEAALAGLLEAGEWRLARAAEVEQRHQAFRRVLGHEPGGFTLASSGAYFGWVRHPFEREPTAQVTRRLILEHDVLAIPGTAFAPTDDGMIRFSFANLDLGSFEDLGSRLEAMGGGA